MENINFSVKDIAKGDNPGYVRIDIQFAGNDKTYSYFRKAMEGCCIIDGCKVSFNPTTLQFEGIERVYETKRKIKKSTVTSKSRKTSEKIKEEMDESEIKIPEVKINEKDFEGPILHKAYEDIRDCLECNIPVYLAGPAGAGKNYTVEQIAKELGWNFYFSNSVQQEYKLTGFIDAGGNFHETEFYKACTDENDCIFFLDEMDASIPEVLILLNAAIANGYFEFPTGRVNLDHVHFVAAGNTVGSGADDVYSGRMVIDQATLDRFAIIEFDYDKRVELNITKGNTDLVNFIHDLRDQAKEKGIRATFSLRCLTMVTKLEAKGMNLVKIVAIAVVKGLDKDTINTFRTNFDNKYSIALDALQKVA